jgi:hypothetical protein
LYNLSKFKKIQELHKIILFYNKERKKNKLFYVIGEDRKIHKADLCSHLALCGTKIIKNFVSEKDYKIYFSCYECTF